MRVPHHMPLSPLLKTRFVDHFSCICYCIRYWFSSSRFLLSNAAEHGVLLIDETKDGVSAHSLGGAGYKVLG